MGSPNRLVRKSLLAKKGHHDDEGWLTTESNGLKVYCTQYTYKRRAGSDTGELEEADVQRL